MSTDCKEWIIILIVVFLVGLICSLCYEFGLQSDDDINPSLEENKKLIKENEKLIKENEQLKGRYKNEEIEII